MTLKKKLTLHIGPHKTGTTAVQSFLSSQRAMLKENGIIYFDKFLNGLTAHSLADAISTNQFEKSADALKEIRNAMGDVLISSENFSRLKNSQITFLASNLEGFDVHIVYYCRNPLRRLVSAWQELVKHGYRFTFPEYISARLLNFSKDLEINDAYRLECWKNNYKAAKLSVHLYDGIPDITAHFVAHHVADSLPFPKETIRENVSTSIATTEVFRASSGIHRTIAMNEEAKRFYGDALNEVCQKVAEHTSKGHFVNTLMGTLETGPFKLIERNIISIFPNLPVVGGALFSERNINWNYIDPNIWIEDSKLAGKLYSLKAEINSKFEPAPLDVRLSRV